MNTNEKRKRRSSLYVCFSVVIAVYHDLCSIQIHRTMIAHSLYATKYLRLKPNVYQAIFAIGPLGKDLTTNFLISSITKIPSASGSGINQNSMGTVAVPKIL